MNKLEQFIRDNYERVKSYADEFFYGDIYQAGEYLLNQI